MPGSQWLFTIQMYTAGRDHGAIFLVVGGSGQIKKKGGGGGETAHSRINILRCLTQLGHERFRRCPATPDAWKKAMSASRARQKDKLSLVFLVLLLVLRCFFIQPTCR